MEAFRRPEVRPLGAFFLVPAVLAIGAGRVALYAAADGVPTHAARQLSGGRWSSKLGRGQDIEHDLRALEGADYGKVVQLLRRRVAG